MPISRREKLITLFAKHWPLLLLLSVASFFSLYKLGSTAFIDSDEATYANVMRESLSRGEHMAFWVTGQPWFEKPPLYFWAMEMFSKLAGGISETSLRLPSALACIAGVFLTWLIAWRETRDRMTAFMAGAIVLTSGLFVSAGRQVSMDVSVTAAILFGYYAFLRGQEQQRWLLGVGVSAGIGVLIKSVIGLLTYPVIFLYAIFTRRWGWLKNRWFWLGNAGGLVIAAPWHIYMSMRFGRSFWDSYLGFHVFARMFRVVAGMPQPSAYAQLRELLASNTPWLLVFFLFGICAAATKLAGLRRSSHATPHFVIGFFLFMFFFLPRTRLLFYFLPALPFMAVAMAMESRALLRKFPTAVGSLALLLYGFGVISTALQVFSPLSHDAFLMRTSVAKEAVVANEQRTISLAMKGVGLPLVAYAWPQFQGHTLAYYADAVNVGMARVNGGVISRESVSGLANIGNGAFLVLAPTALSSPDPEIPPSLLHDLNATILFQDISFTLYKIDSAYGSQ